MWPLGRMPVAPGNTRSHRLGEPAATFRRTGLTAIGAARTLVALDPGRVIPAVSVQAIPCGRPFKAC